MNNTVIANRKKGDWPIIKKYFEDRGVDTKNYIGMDIEEKESISFYYGTIKGFFSNYSIKTVQQANATILEVSDIYKEFKVGDVVVGWHHSDNENFHTPWEIAKIDFSGDEYYAYPKGSTMSNTSIKNLKHYISDTVTLPKSFVLQAHKEACIDWKKRIEDALPELFVKPIPKELQSLIDKHGKEEIIKMLK